MERNRLLYYTKPVRHSLLWEVKPVHSESGTPLRFSVSQVAILVFNGVGYSNKGAELSIMKVIIN